MTINFPLVALNIVREQALAAAQEHRVLIVGQKTSAGSATSGSLQEDVSEATNDINALFGARSIVAECVREFKKINKLSPLDVIPLTDNVSGVAATATVAFTGTATATGTIFVEIGSGFNYRFQVDIASGDTAAAVAIKLQAAIALSTSAPFTAAVDTADVDITAANAGTAPNTWTIFVDGVVAGIAATITAWNAGATNPSLTNIFNVVTGRRYQTVVWPESYDAATIETFMAARFNFSDDVLQGVAIITAVGSNSELKARALAFNDQSIVLFGVKEIARTALTGACEREFPDVISSKIAAVRSLRFTDLASLTGLITTTAPLDQFGGRAIATLPYANTILPNSSISKPQDQLTSSEMSDLTNNGVALVGPNRSFTSTILGEVVTTSLTNPAGDPDESFKYLNTVDAAAAIRDAYVLNSRIRFGQSRLTDGDLREGRDMVNQASFEAFTEEIWQSLAEDTIVQDGSAALRDFRRTRQVSVDVRAGRITLDIAPLLVSQVRAIVGTITVNFGS